MKHFFYLVLFHCCIVTTIAQPPAEPILRIENGMHTGVAGQMSTDAAGNRLLTCCEDKTARLWDANDGKLLNTLRIPIGNTNEGKIDACALSPDGTLAALGGDTGHEWDSTYCVYIENTQTNKILHRITGLPGKILDLQFSPDGQWLAIALPAGGGVKIYETATWRQVKNLEDYKEDVTHIAFDKNNRLATISGSFVKIYNKHVKYDGFAYSEYAYKPISIAFDPSGKLLAVGYDQGSPSNIDILATPPPNLFSAFNDARLGRWYATEGDAHCLSYSRDGQRLYTGNNKRILDDNEIWKTALLVLDGDPLKADRTIPLMKDDILQIKTLASGNIAVLSAYPDIAVLSASEKLLWYKSAPISHFYHLRVNHSGTAISFINYGLDSINFDITSRSPLNSFSSVSFSSLKNQAEYLQIHQDVHFNDALALIVGKDEIIMLKRKQADEALVGTNKYLYKIKISPYGRLKIIWKTALSSQPGDIFYGDDQNFGGKSIMVSLWDGTIRWFNINDGKEILAFYLDADIKKWVLFTPDGYYDAAPGAEELLGWHINNGKDDAPSFYPVSRFKQQYYRPDIVDSVLRANSGEPPATTTIPGNKKTNNNIPVSIKQRLPPIISISNPTSGAVINSQTIKISYSVKTPDDSKVKSIKVLVNGRPVSVNRGAEVQVVDNSITVQIPPADCTITLLAENDNGISPEANLYLKYKAPDKPADVFVKKPTLYLLAIGISDYNNPAYKLNFAEIDAAGFIAEMQKQKGLLYQDVVVKPLLDKNATRENIQDGLQWIQDQTSQQDIAMIFYAGHGVNDNNGIFYMLPVGADANRLRSTCVNFEDLKQTVSNIAGKVMVFIDACHSGNIMGTTDRRGINDINAVINELSGTENGAVTFTSSTGREYSLESTTWMHGAFTKALLEGFDGKAAVPGKNKITVKSLDAFVSERVKDLTNGKQHPTSVVPPNVPDFPIAAW